MKSSWMQALGRRRLCQSLPAHPGPISRSVFRHDMAGLCTNPAHFWLQTTFWGHREHCLPSSQGSIFLCWPHGADMPTALHPLKLKVLGQPSGRQTLPLPSLPNHPLFPRSISEHWRAWALWISSSPCPTTDIPPPATAYSDGGRKQGIKKSSVWHKQTFLLGAEHTLNSLFMVSVLKVRTWLYFFVDVDTT